MPTEIADELKMFSKPGVMQHAPGVATHGRRSTCPNRMMLVQHELMRAVGNRAQVHHCLAVILTVTFQPIQLE